MRLGVINRKADFKTEIQQGKIHLVSCAMIYPNKRIDLLIRSLALIDQFEVDWEHFGEAYDPKDFTELKQLADELLTAKPNVHFDIPGFRSNEEVFNYYSENNVDLLVNLSESEGVPVSFMECLSFGVPVMATKVGGVAEIVTPDNGFLLSPNPSPEEIAQRLKDYYYSSTNEKLKLRENAFKMWKERYDADVNYQQLISEIEVLVDSNAVRLADKRNVAL